MCPGLLRYNLFRVSVAPRRQVARGRRFFVFGPVNVRNPYNRKVHTSRSAVVGQRVHLESEPGRGAGPLRCHSRTIAFGRHIRHVDRGPSTPMTERFSTLWARYNVGHRRRPPSNTPLHFRALFSNSYPRPYRTFQVLYSVIRDTGMRRVSPHYLPTSNGR